MRTEKLDFATFAPDARRFFEADDLVATVPITVIDALGAGVAYGADPPELYVVRDEHDAPTLFALRTPPFPLLFAAGEAASAFALGRALATWDTPLNGARRREATGPEPLVDAFAQGYGDGSRASLEITASRPTLFYRADALVPPPAVPGATRRATTNDARTLVDLFADFQRAVGVPVPIGAATVARAIDERRIFVHEHDGEIVSVAQRAGFTRTNARVNLVFTPSAHRGRGFAGAAVAALVEDILRQRPVACLFADAENETSNALYRRLGFLQVTRHTTVDIVRR